MMSPVAYDHRSDPSRATLYSLPSCDPTRTEPSPATAGDETTGPPVANVHQTTGLTAGSTNGDRPRWVGPNRNIACAGSTAYWGNGTDGPPSPGAATDGRVASPGQTHRPASHSRLSLQSLSAAQGEASTWAHPVPARPRAATIVKVTRRPACVGPVKAEPGARGARSAPGGRARRARRRTWNSDGARLRQIGKAARPSDTLAHRGQERRVPAGLRAARWPASLAAAAPRSRPAARAQRAASAGGRRQAAAPKSGRAAIRHVVIISEDGLRPDALTGVRPPTHEAILKRAAYSFRAQTIRRASTLPSHAAMLSGFDVKEHGLYWNSWKPDRGYIQVPTVFDAAKKGGGESAAFVGKHKLAHIAHPGSGDVVSRPGYFCKKVVEEAARYFVEKRPAIEFIHFSDPDDLGHSDGWMSNQQLESVRTTDRCLATLLDAVVGRRPRSRDAVHHLG